MFARTRFFSRYGNVIVASVVGLLAMSGIGQGDVAFSMLCGVFLVAVALSVHATERMASLESEDEWNQSLLREAELHRQMSSIVPQVSEV